VPSREVARSSQNPAEAFPHRCQCVGVFIAKKEILQLWGLLSGLLIHLGESQYISNQLPTTFELVEPERVAGLSVFRSTS
jgi:hypothetical protein